MPIAERFARRQFVELGDADEEDIELSQIASDKPETESVLPSSDDLHIDVYQPASRWDRFVAFFLCLGTNHTMLK